MRLCELAIGCIFLNIQDTLDLFLINNISLIKWTLIQINITEHEIVPIDANNTKQLPWTVYTYNRADMGGITQDLPEIRNTFLDSGPMTSSVETNWTHENIYHKPVITIV